MTKQKTNQNFLLFSFLLVVISLVSFCHANPLSAPNWWKWENKVQDNGKGRVFVEFFPREQLAVPAETLKRTWEARHEQREKNLAIMRSDGNGGATHDFQFIPTWLATMFPSENSASSFSSSCFRYSGSLSKISSENNNLQYTVTLNATQRVGHLFCKDLLLIGDAERLFVHKVDGLGASQIEFLVVSGAVENTDLRQQGLQILQFVGGMEGLVEDVIDTLLLFYGPWTEERSLDFLNVMMGIEYAPRQPNSFVDLPLDNFQSGDYLATCKFSGSEVLIAYGTGSYSGHSTMVMELNGELNVCEDTGQNSPADPWPAPFGIVCHPIEQWFEIAQKVGYMVTHMPLAKEYRDRWNQNSAERYLKSVMGDPYGLSNFVFTFIDTMTENYPPPLSPQFIPLLLGLLDRFAPSLNQVMFLDAINHRLETNCTGLPCILEATFAQGYQNLTEVIIIPEQDEWRYGERGAQMVCDSLVVAVWEAAGIFPNMTFQATEFTPRDLYTMKVFDDTSPRPSQCTTSPKDLPNLCQIMGDYQAQFPMWNTIEPYDNMCNHCAAMPPDYIRGPSNC